MSDRIGRNYSARACGMTMRNLKDGARLDAGRVLKRGRATRKPPSLGLISYKERPPPGDLEPTARVFNHTLAADMPSTLTLLHCFPSRSTRCSPRQGQCS